jgi:hypothetical protein
VRSVLPAALTFALALTACGGDSTGTGPEEYVAVTLTNHTSGVITLLVPGEPINCASCQLAQNGGYRTVNFLLRHGGSKTFRAVLGGAVQDDITCIWEGEEAVSVDWQENKLHCIVWAAQEKN